MRICLTPRVGGGGPASFQSRLAEAWRSAGVDITHDPDSRPLDAVIVFAGTRALGSLLRCRRDRIPIIHRLDGINWLHRRRPTPAGLWVRAEARQGLVRIIRRCLADRLIYQSRFVESWWEGWYGRTAAPTRVIWNGLPLGDRPAPPREAAGTILSAEGNLHFLEPVRAILHAVDGTLLRGGEFSRMRIFGRHDASWEREWPRFSSGLQRPGMVSRAEILNAMDAAAVFLSLEIQPPCPNAVIEALARGLPVVGFDTGSLREIIGGGGIAVAYAGDPWKLETPANLDALLAALRDAAGHRREYSERARREAETRFDIRLIANQYMKAVTG